jgi:shikimate kinase
MNNVYLIGLPGSGKSTIGKLYAKKINKKFIDLDKYIVNREKKTIPMLFEEGEAVFRKAETEALKEITEKFSGCIVATGGGIVETPENIELLKKQTVIYLYRPIPLILSTLNADKRPLLKIIPKNYMKYGEDENRDMKKPQPIRSEITGASVIVSINY